MKVLVTGSKGFLGGFVSRYLSLHGIEVLDFDKGDPFPDFSSIDFLFHFAGVNRSEEESEFFEGNVELTKRLIESIEASSRTAPLPFYFASSIHAGRDDAFGKSKLEAERILGGSKAIIPIIERLPNIFGPYMRPHYNSVIATWCDELASGNSPKADDPNKTIPLCYVEEVGERCLNLLNGKGNNPLSPRLISLAEALGILHDAESGWFMGNDYLSLRLMSTYFSYLPLERLHGVISSKADARGSFTELFRGGMSGQLSSNLIKPNQTKGGHFHLHKSEIFFLLNGKARFTLEKAGVKKEFDLDAASSAHYVIVPPYWTHSIENVGSSDCLFLIYCNESFDPDHPDTYRGMF